jgi:hypothetical protein
MAAFRGSDERLDREIETLEEIARTRVRRVARELRDVDKDLAELRRERAKRRAAAETSTSQLSGEPVESG